MIKMKMCIERKDNSIGETIRRCRLYYRYSHKKLGMKVGFNEKNAASRIYQYEVGRCVACPKIAERIADALGICKYALLPNDTTNEKGMYFDVLNLIERCGFDLVEYDDSFAITIPKDAESLKKYMKHYHKARNAIKLGLTGEEDYHWNIRTIDFLDDFE